MCKYKHFAVIVGGLIILLIAGCFTLSYDGNDDQLMQFIVSGTLTGIADSNIIFQHVFVGKVLCFLYTTFPYLNWYVLFLICVHLLAAGMLITGLFYQTDRQNDSVRMALFIILLFGFYALYIVAIQYTTTSLLIGIAALTILSGKLPSGKKIISASVGIILCMLIREQVFYLIVLLSIPILLQSWNTPERNPVLITISISVFFYFFLSYTNHHLSGSLLENYRSYISASEIIINRPLNLSPELLKKHPFSIDDLLLIQNWYGADPNYNTPAFFNFAKDALSVRNSLEVLILLKSFLKDERYMLLMYLISFLSVLWLCHQDKKWAVLNLFLFIIIYVYLLYNMRIPRRVVSPLLFYISWRNLLLLLQYAKPSGFRTAVFSVLVLLSGYKFYCVYQLNQKNETNANTFETVKKEINNNPDVLFIAASFPLELMKVDFSNTDIFTHNNIIFTGWYINTPNFLQLLTQHRLTDLTAGIKDRKDILFLSDSNAFEAAFVRVMLQRYAIKCHFEDAESGFTYLHPKRLVFDN